VINLAQLSTDVLAHILVHVPLAHDIARAALCRALRDAVQQALALRRYTGIIVTLNKHSMGVFLHPGLMYGRPRRWGGCRIAETAAVTPDGRILTGSLDGVTRLWTPDGVCVLHTRAARSFGSVHALLSIGEHVISGGRDTLIITRLLRNVPDEPSTSALMGTLEHVVDVPGDEIDVFDLAAMPDGVHFVVAVGYELTALDGAFSGVVLMYHIDGTLVHAFWGHNDIVIRVVVTRDGQYIISASNDETIKVWCVATPTAAAVRTFHGDDTTHRFSALAVTPDGRRILGGTSTIDDGRGDIWVWGFDGTVENTFVGMHHNEMHLTPVQVRAYTCSVSDIVALPDNAHALSGSRGFTVKLFNINDGAVLRLFTHHSGPVHRLALLPDDLRFVSCGYGDDGAAYIVEHGLKVT
jgi:WD40 repeat protein